MPRAPRPWLGVALATALALGAAGGASAAALRWAAQNDVLTLDPHSQDHTTTSAILQHAYEGLTRYNEQWEVEPCLATKWTTVSPTQWRFELRRGVKFHDGSPFTADDVIFSFQRIRQPQGTMQIYVTGIKEIKKIDDYTIDLILEAPQPILLRNLIDFRIMSKTWAEKNKATQQADYKSKDENFASRNASGTGPFKITGWQPDQKVTMEVNKSWWDKPRGNITELSYLPIKSDPTRVAALVTGDVDMLTDVPVQDVLKLKQDPKLKVIEGPETRTIFFAMDLGSDELRGASVKGKNPFKDARVREALSLAIDREAIKRSIMRGMSVPAALMVAPGVNGHAADIDKPLPPDLPKARKLLAEAGYPSGFEVPLNCPNNRYINDEEICLAVVSMWSKIGIQARLVAQPMSQHSQLFQRFESPLFMLGWGVSTRDALYSLQALAHTRTGGGADGSFNFSKVSDATLDKLIDAAKSETDAVKRDALLRDALLRVRDQHLFIPLHHQVRPWVVRANVDTPHRSNDRPEARFTTVK
ncbi:ABC transporter substrate-binding protein [Roseateles amylovorans]|uniref:ABC transporter substrate-binding protein n=1 Tax=Roseateles amylovorans TaxID=2978473 RepID=A0ABY6AV55_9BURK|nr:ABC transporter substrate-binding protein [Roseateles amylovorans]UXH77084.1 ABC transporter substrate-binding protein [Roseateles amylovorans]